MTQEIMWSLLIAVGAIAIVAVLDSVKHRRELHLSDEELSRAREKIDLLQQEHQQAISNLEQKHTEEKKILGNQIYHLAKSAASQQPRRVEYSKYVQKNF